MNNFIELLIKPDNMPIAGMLFLTIFFGGLSFYLAIKNDRLRKRNKKRRSDSSAKNRDIVDLRDVVYNPGEMGTPANIHCWPYLMRLELLTTILVLALLIAWSILIDAPLEQPANPGITPNPAKAPWYFLGLQDMLVYFDPWIAGVVLPTLIIVGLMAIPYVDAHPEKGNGYFTLSERKFPILTFGFGFFVLWVLLIIVGTFFRGPGWMWFWPWEKWDPQRVVSETNINLNEFLGHLTNISGFMNENVGFVFGFIVIAGYYLAGSLIPYIILKRKSGSMLKKLGLVRYLIISFLFWTMMSLPIKIVLRLFFNIKYIWVTPWFNI